MEQTLIKRHGAKDVVASEVGVLAVFARFFIGWNEGSWGEEYYLEEYETGIFSDFGGMLTVILVTGIVCLIVGIIVWLIGRRVE